MKKIIKYALKIFFSPLDFLIAITLLFVIIILSIFKHIDSKTRKKSIKVIFIVPGGSIKSIMNKFGTLDVYKDDNPNNFFYKCYKYLILGNSDINLKLDKNYLIYERKIFLKIFILTYITSLVLEINRTIFKENISLVHAKDPYLSGLIAIIVNKFTKIPFCVSIHSDYDKRYELDKYNSSPIYLGSRKLAKKIERFVLRNTPIVMPIRESLRAYAIKSGAKPESIRIIPHGIDIKPYLSKPDGKIIQDYGLTGKKIIVFVGRLSRENYVYDILEIAKIVSKSVKSIIFLIIGDGIEANNLKKKASFYKLSNIIKFIGFQPHIKIASFRKIADVNLCLMGGFSLIEAAAAGKPLIAYDVEWHYEIVKNNVTGFLIEEHDTEGAAKAILKLFGDKELSYRLGKNAKKISINNYSIETSSKIKIKYYKELIEKYAL